MDSTVPDAALVVQVLTGDKSAFSPLITRHRHTALSLAGRLLGRQADAEDIVQEAFLQAFLGLSQLRAPDRFLPWLLGIIINLCRVRRRAQRGPAVSREHDERTVISPILGAESQPSSEALCEIREQHRTVLAAIATLPDEQQRAVQMYYLDGLMLWEISLLADIPIGTVKAQLHRARSHLRLVLTKEGVTTARECVPRGKKETSS